MYACDLGYVFPFEFVAQPFAYTQTYSPPSLSIS